jgi:hypothetical protein
MEQGEVLGMKLNVVITMLEQWQHFFISKFLLEW